MKSMKFQHREAEKRLCCFFKEIGSNVKEWGGYVNDRYLAGPWKRGDNFQKIMGPINAGVSVLTETGDAILAGIADNRIQYDAAFRTPRDVGQAAKHLVTLHPIKFVTDVLRLPGDLGMDALDIAGGFHTEASRRTAVSRRSMYETLMHPSSN